MSENNKSDLDQESKDEQETSSELKIKNICGTCDALDLPPPCRGHGGGGGR